MESGDADSLSTLDLSGIGDERSNAWHAAERLDEGLDKGEEEEQLLASARSDPSSLGQHVEYQKAYDSQSATPPSTKRTSQHVLMRASDSNREKKKQKRDSGPPHSDWGNVQQLGETVEQVEMSGSGPVLMAHALSDPSQHQMDPSHGLHSPAHSHAHTHQQLPSPHLLAHAQPVHYSSTQLHGIPGQHTHTNIHTLQGGHPFGDPHSQHTVLETDIADMLNTVGDEEMPDEHLQPHQLSEQHKQFDPRSMHLTPAEPPKPPLGVDVKPLKALDGYVLTMLNPRSADDLIEIRNTIPKLPCYHQCSYTAIKIQTAVTVHPHIPAAPVPVVHTSYTGAPTPYPHASTTPTSFAPSGPPSFPTSAQTPSYAPNAPSAFSVPHTNSAYSQQPQTPAYGASPFPMVPFSPFSTTLPSVPLSSSSGSMPTLPPTPRYALYSLPPPFLSNPAGETEPAAESAAPPPPQTDLTWSRLVCMRVTKMTSWVLVHSRATHRYKATINALAAAAKNRKGPGAEVTVLKVQVLLLPLSATGGCSDTQNPKLIKVPNTSLLLYAPRSKPATNQCLHQILIDAAYDKKEGKRKSSKFEEIRGQLNIAINDKAPTRRRGFGANRRNRGGALVKEFWTWLERSGEGKQHPELKDGQKVPQSDLPVLVRFFGVACALYGNLTGALLSAWDEHGHLVYQRREPETVPATRTEEEIEAQTVAAMRGRIMQRSTPVLPRGHSPVVAPPAPGNYFMEIAEEAQEEPQDVQEREYALEHHAAHIHHHVGPSQQGPQQVAEYIDPDHYVPQACDLLPLSYVAKFEREGTLLPRFLPLVLYQQHYYVLVSRRAAPEKGNWPRCPHCRRRYADLSKHSCQQCQHCGAFYVRTHSECDVSKLMYRLSRKMVMPRQVFAQNPPDLRRVIVYDIEVYMDEAGRLLPYSAAWWTGLDSQYHEAFGANCVTEMVNSFLQYHHLAKESAAAAVPAGGVHVAGHGGATGPGTTHVQVGTTHGQAALPQPHVQHVNDNASLLNPLSATHASSSSLSSVSLSSHSAASVANGVSAPSVSLPSLASIAVPAPSIGSHNGAVEPSASQETAERQEAGTDSGEDRGEEPTEAEASDIEQHPTHVKEEASLLASDRLLLVSWNASRFDVHLLLQEMLSGGHRRDVDVLDVANVRILGLSNPYFRFADLALYFARDLSLSQACDMLSVPVEKGKGFFPPSFVKGPYSLEYHGPVPELSAFSQRDAERLTREGYVAGQGTWDAKLECSRQLRRDIAAVVSLTKEVSGTFWNQLGVDIAEHSTLPELAYSLWARLSLWPKSLQDAGRDPELTMGRIPEQVLPYHAPLPSHKEDPAASHPSASLSLSTPRIQRVPDHLEFTTPEIHSFAKDACYPGRMYPVKRQFVSRHYEALLSHSLTYEQVTDDYLLELEVGQVYPIALRTFDYPTGGNAWVAEGELGSVLEQLRQGTYPKLGIFEVVYKPKREMLLPVLPRREQSLTTADSLSQLISPTTTEVQSDTYESHEFSEGVYTTVDILRGLRAGYEIHLKKGIVWETKAPLFKAFIRFAERVQESGSHSLSLSHTQSLSQSHSASSSPSSSSSLSASMGSLLVRSLFAQLLNMPIYSRRAFLREKDRMETLLNDFNIEDWSVLEPEVGSVAVKSKLRNRSSAITRPAHLGVFVLSYCRLLMDEKLALLSPSLSMDGPPASLQTQWNDAPFYCDSDRAFVRVFSRSQEESELQHFQAHPRKLSKEGTATGRKIVRAIFISPRVYALQFVCENGEMPMVFEAQPLADKHGLTWDDYEEALRGRGRLFASLSPSPSAALKGEPNSGGTAVTGALPARTPAERALQFSAFPVANRIVERRRHNRAWDSRYFESEEKENLAPDARGLAEDYLRKYSARKEGCHWDVPSQLPDQDVLSDSILDFGNSEQ